MVGDDGSWSSVKSGTMTADALELQIRTEEGEVQAPPTYSGASAIEQTISLNRFYLSIWPISKTIS